MNTPLAQRPAAQRECFLDLLRILACFLVIVNHTAGDLLLTKGPQERAWFAAVAYFFFSKPAVLIFYMISGYLLLGRQDSWETTWRRVSRILIVLLCCTVIYGIYDDTINISGISVRGLLFSVLGTINSTPSRALWYLYTYMGLLIMLPFLQKMAAAMEKKDYYILIGLSFLFVSTIPMLEHFSSYISVFEGFQLPLFSSAIAMLFAGNYFARYGVKKTRGGFVLAAVIVVAMVAFNTWATWWEYRRVEDENYLFFDNREWIPIVLSAVCLFYMAYCLTFPPRLAKVISNVGACTFGMYLLGDLLNSALLPLIPLLNRAGHALIGLVLFELVIFLAAFVIVALLRRIPWVRKLI